MRTQILLPSEIRPRLRAAKDDYEEYTRKVIGRAYFLVLNKIDELDGTNERLLKYFKENIKKY